MKKETQENKCTIPNIFYRCKSATVSNFNNLKMMIRVRNIKYNGMKLISGFFNKSFLEKKSYLSLL